MLKVLGCITRQHDLRLVFLAAIMCVLASVAASALLSRAQASSGRLKRIWVLIAAVEFGSGIWSLHFVAMIAFMPWIPIGYDIADTVLSILVAIGGALGGFGLAMFSRNRVVAVLGGTAFLTLAIGGMHYLGISGMRLHGSIVFDPAGVIWSLVTSAALCAAALTIMADLRPLGRQAGATLLLTLAICVLHFTGMSAMTLQLGDNGNRLTGVLGSNGLAIAVGALSIAMLLLSFALTVVDRHLSSRLVREKERLRQLVSVSFEGLLIERNGTILDANDRLYELSGYAPGTLTGVSVSSLILRDGEADDHTISAANAEPRNLRVKCLNGTTRPVELLVRVISYDSEPANAVAIRDLTAHRNNEAAMRRLGQISALLGTVNAPPASLVTSLIGVVTTKTQGEEPAPVALPVAKPPARSIGQLQAISLAALTATYGAGWNRVASRALLMAEQIIKRRLDPKDVFTRGDDQDFIVWFHGTDQEKNEAVLIRISREIRVCFLTEFSKDVSAYVDAVLVKDEPDGAARPDPSAPAVASSALLGRLGDERKRAAHEAKALLQELHDSPAADVQPVIDRALKLKPIVVVDFLPSVRRRMFDLGAPLGREPEGGAGVDLLRLDLAIRELGGRRGSRNVLVPISWAALTEPGRRRSVDECFRHIEPGLRRFLMLAVAEVPPRAGETRWSEIAGPLRRQLGDVGLMVTLAEGDIVGELEAVVGAWPLSLLVIDATEPQSMAPDGYFGLIAAARRRGIEVLIQPARIDDIRDWRELGATMFTGAAQ